MTKYLINSDRNKITIFLILLSIIFASLINAYIYPSIEFLSILYDGIDNQSSGIFTILGISLAPITYQVIYSVLNLVYDKYLWKISIATCSLFNNIPNLNGNWEGYINSSWQEDGEYSRRKVNMSICQTFNKIEIISKFYNKKDECRSTSKAFLISLEKYENNNRLKFAFENRSNELGTVSKDYKGYNQMDINKNNDKMEGYYFTGRDPDPMSGIMSLSKVIK